MTITVTIKNTATPQQPLCSAQASSQALSQASSHPRPTEQIILPLPPTLTDLAAGQDTRFEMEVYARFMRHLRSVPNSRMEIKILSSIRFTADMLEVREELIAKTLVDLGLRAPRKALPCAFLDFCDKCLLRQNWEVQNSSSDIGGLPAAVRALKEHWENTGEDRFGLLPTQYAVYNAGALI